GAAADHRRLRHRRHRRPRLDPRLDRHRPRRRHHRGADQDLLSRGLGDRRLRADGGRPAAAPARTVRKGEVMRALTATWGFGALFLAFMLIAPYVGLYPIFLMKLLCFALFACAFNLMLGFVGLLSFGHAAFFGMAAYLAGHSTLVWGLPP